MNVSATFVHDQTDIDLELYDPQQNVVSVSATASDNESLSAVALFVLARRP